MGSFHIDRSTQNRVIAMFQSSAHSIDLPQNATFADLADRLADLGEWHDGALISVDVTVGSENWTRSRRRGRYHSIA
jgi:hypothetical protein